MVRGWELENFVCPVGFLSKKFSAAQQNYQTHEHEIICYTRSAHLRWEDKLLGREKVRHSDRPTRALSTLRLNQASLVDRLGWWEGTYPASNFTVSACGQVCHETE